MFWFWIEIYTKSQTKLMVLFCDEEKERVETLLQSVSMNENKKACVIEDYFGAAVIYVNDFFNNCNHDDIDTDNYSSNYYSNTNETKQVGRLKHCVGCVIFFVTTYQEYLQFSV